MKNIIVAIVCSICISVAGMAQTVKTTPEKVNPSTTNVVKADKKNETTVKKTVPRKKKNLTLTTSRTAVISTNDTKGLKK